MSSVVIVYDAVIPHFLGNRIFDRDYSAQFPGASVMPCLYDLVTQRGWQMITADVFLKNQPNFDLALCISERVTPRTEQLIDRGVIPVVLTSGESPNVDWRFYHKISSYSQKFKHAFLFRGTERYVKQPTQFHTFFWPNARRDVLPGPKWSEREFLVMVSANKGRHSVVPNRPLVRMRRLAKRLIWNYLQVVDPLFRHKDLYKERLEAICYFSDHPGFKLFGKGWDQPSGLSKRYFRAVQRLDAKPVDDKLLVMSNFKFALCFENCVFPGYVTEKIFDCFFAGCIPVYYGAPDITDFVPPETFINFCQFQDISDMNKYLFSLSDVDAFKYLESARNFLSGVEFNKFHQDTFAQQLLEIIKKESL